MNQRILGRRYPLNKSRSTCLEVGIAVVPQPAVQIALINKRNQEVILSESVWHDLQQKKATILNYLSDNSKAKLPDEQIGDITLIYGKVDGNNAICFHVPDEEVIILHETCVNLFRMHDSVLNTTDYLDQEFQAVTDRLEVIKNIVKNIGNKRNVNVYDRVVSDRNYKKQSLIDSEIAALCLSGILGSANK